MLSAVAARKKTVSTTPSPISIDDGLNFNSNSQPEATKATQAKETQNSKNSRLSPPILAPVKRKQTQNDTSGPPGKRKKKNANTTGSTTATALAGSRTSTTTPKTQEQNSANQERTPVAIPIPVSRGYSPSEPVTVEGETSSIINQPTIISTFQPQLGHNVFFDFQDHLISTSTFARSAASDSTPASTSIPVIYLIFKPEDTLCFLGTVLLTVLQGSILLFGSPLHESSISYPVFAPRSYPVASISVISASSDYSSSSKSRPLSEGADLSGLPQSIRGAISPFDVVIKVQDLNSGIEGLGDVCGGHQVSFKALPDFEFDFKLREFSPIRCGSPSLSPLITPPQWKDALSLLEVAENVPSVLIKGPKNSGKSIFSRMLVNNLLLRHKYVAYIDCDPGQTEFTPPGMVSLHVLRQPILGPPFTHPRQPFKAHFVGSTSIRSSTTHFLACIDDLLESYRLDVKHTYELEHSDHNGDSEYGQDEDAELHLEAPKQVPLVINTFGWVKGVGADALQYIEGRADLTHIISLDPSSSDPVWVTPTHVDKRSTEVTYLSISSFEHTRQDQNQANKRALMIMSYFYHEDYINESRSQEETRPTERGIWVTYKPLCARPPWEVTWDSIDKMILIGSGAEDVVSSELLRVLNGAIVALVSVVWQGRKWSSSSLTERQNQKRIPYEQGAPPPAPNISNCLGLALVRSVRPANGTIHILTPIAPALLARCGTMVLIMGEIRLPVWGMLDHRPDSRNAGQIAGVDLDLVPFLDRGKGPQGISGSKTLRVRRNLMRKGQA